MSACSSPPRIGFYGKLPSHGDFVGAVLTRATVTAWHDWLDASWTPPPDDVTRVWRVAVAPGLCGPHGLSGVVLRGHDRVGRRFPLLLVREDLPLPDVLLDRLAALGGASTFAHLSERLSALDAPEAGLDWPEGVVFRHDGDVMAADALPDRVALAHMLIG